MLHKLILSAVAATLVTTAAAAQSTRDLGAPANYPPSGFSGQQFVDNKGCVYLRAGFGSTVNWVPRVQANRRPLCGQPPTFGAAVAAAADAAMQPDPQAGPDPRTQIAAAAPPAIQTRPYPGDPIRLVPPPPMQPSQYVAPAVAAPVIAPVAAPQRTYAAAVTSAQAQCVPAAPQLETVLLRDGGTALVCTRGDGTIDGWRSPLFPQGAIGAALTPRMMQGARLASTRMASTYAPAPRTANAIPTPPPGYRLAWTDDRLNPARGLGTAAGQAQQDQVWTRTVPANDVNAKPTRRGLAAVLAPVTATPAATAPRTTVSSMSAPAQAQAQAQAFVQVGTFGEPANASGVKARLSALGLPVSTSQITRKGRVLQIVYAGPFASTAEAQSALATTRSAGFSDAILK